MSSPNSGKKAPLDDWIFWCDICGLMEFASKGIRLDTYSGHGGAMVCCRCNDSTDWYEVPYQIPAEQPIPWSRPNYLYDAPPSQIAQTYPPYNYTTLRQNGINSPAGNAAASYSWDKQTFLTWNQWNSATWDEIQGLQYIA